MFLALTSTMVFSVMDSPKNVMQLRLRPAQDEKPIFFHDFFVIEVGAHHIYDDTGFCHNYRHRSVICMTGKKFVRPKMSQMCLFFVVCPMEEDRDHDMEEADDDPNQYFNTAFDNEVTMSQPYEYEMHVPEPERPRE